MNSKKKLAMEQTNGTKTKELKSCQESQNSEILRQKEIIKQAEDKLKDLKEQKEKARVAQPATVGDIECLQKLITMLELHIKRLEQEVCNKNTKIGDWEDTRIPYKPYKPYKPYEPSTPVGTQTWYTGTGCSGVGILYAEHSPSFILPMDTTYGIVTHTGCAKVTPRQTFSCCLKNADGDEECTAFLIGKDGMVVYCD